MSAGPGESTGDEPVTFSEVRDALMPPGANREALWSALKNAQRTGLFHRGATAPDISMGPVVTGLSGTGVRPEIMKALAAGADRLEDVHAALEQGQREPEPRDPFSQGHVAAVGLAEMYSDMLAAKIPLGSVERILGAMLAAHAIMDAGDG